MSVVGKGSSHVNLSISGNIVEENGNYGIDIYSAAYMDMVVQGNTARGGTTGIHINDQHWRGSLSIKGNDVSEAAEDGIYCYNYYRTTCGPRLLDNHVHNNGGHGIHVFRGGNSSTVRFEMRGNEVIDNSGSGIYCEQQGSNMSGRILPVITLNTVTGNGGYGMFIQASEPAEIFYNDVHDNGGNGLYLAAVDGSMVHYNNIYDNLGAYELANGNSAAVNVRHNYWGADITAQMATGDNPKNIDGIIDVKDDESLGTVYYVPWLSDSQSLPTGPASRFVTPANGMTLPNAQFEATGIAVSPSGIASVEVSVDGGSTWQTATGTDHWSVPVTLPGDGEHQLISRETDSASIVETPGDGITVTVDTSLPTTSGTLTTDEIWSGELTITGDVTIPAGITLTIESGARIRFMKDYDETIGGLIGSTAELIVHGTLIANGAVFTSSAASPAAGDWYGIRVPVEENDASVSLTNCTIAYGQIGLWVPATNIHSVSIILNNTTISNSVSHGVHIEAKHGIAMTLTVDGCNFSNNGDRGFYAYSENSNTQISGRISNCTIAGNGNHGLSAVGKGISQVNLSITGNIVEENSNYGVDIYAVAYMDMVVQGNTVRGGTTGIHINDQDWRGSLSIIDNDVSEAAGDGIYCYNYRQTACAPRLLDNHVHDNGGHGIHVFRGYNSSTVRFEMRGNEVIGNSGSGIYCEQQGSNMNGRILPVITLNTVTGNDGYGMFIQASQPAEIFYNDIQYNGGNGLYLGAVDGSAVHYNHILNNLGSYDLANGNSASIDASFNYWGSAVIAEMELGGNPKNITRINDSFDDAALGTVDYSEWIAESTDPQGDDDLIDSEPDGLPDKWQTIYLPEYTSGNCTTCAAQDDYDGDDISNLVEYRLGTDPSVPNSKGPGIYYEYDALGRIIKILRIPSTIE